MDYLLQFLFSGLTRGSVYAVVGIGFAIIYSASRVINFAQGEFVMMGGMVTAWLATSFGVPVPLAALAGIAAAVATGVALERLVVGRARAATPTTLIIITIGASIFIRGAVEVLLGKRDYMLPAFSGDVPIAVGQASLQPQSLWVLATLVVVGLLLKWLLGHTLAGKAMLATAQNDMAAKIVGINTRRVLLYSFAASGALGAVAGIVITPITLTRFDIGVMLGLKGFCAAIIGGIASPFGAIAGGLGLGILEALAGGYISSAYQDAVAFLVLLAVLFLRPDGLFAPHGSERV